MVCFSSVFRLETGSAHRFLTFSLPVQRAITLALREQAGLKEVGQQVPVEEWIHLLRLADPLIQVAPRAQPYALLEGQQLVQLLLSQYLDIV